MSNHKKIFYKGIRVNSFSLPVLNEEKIIKKNKIYYHSSFLSPFKKNSPKNLIVMYDIPSTNKKERDYFRRHLIKFNYVMIQKSVWVGPSPLPNDFIKYIKSIGLKDKIKILKLAEEYNQKGNKILKNI